MVANGWSQYERVRRYGAFGNSPVVVTLSPRDENHAVSIYDHMAYDATMSQTEGIFHDFVSQEDDLVSSIPCLQWLVKEVEPQPVVSDYDEEDTEEDTRGGMVSDGYRKRPMTFLTIPFASCMSTGSFMTILTIGTNCRRLSRRTGNLNTKQDKSPCLPARQMISRKSAIRFTCSRLPHCRPDRFRACPMPENSWTMLSPESSSKSVSVLKQLWIIFFLRKPML